VAQMTHAPVLVGVTGLAQNLLAVDIGACEASYRKSPLLIVSAYPQPASGPGVDARRARDDAERRAATAAAGARRRRPELTIIGAVVPGDLDQVLIDRARQAGLLVIGDGRSGLPSSMTATIVTRAECPVIVAPPDGGRTPMPFGPVMVGVEGDGQESSAIAFAMEEAGLRGVPLRAVHVWVNIPDLEQASVDPFVYDLAEARRDADRLIRTTLAEWSWKYPQVPVERLPIYQVDVEAALAKASATVGLLVLGSRGGRTGARFGSMSRAMISHSACPVAFVSNP
jgi:nucleotide-binding universal stress UspA family protein